MALAGGHRPHPRAIVFDLDRSLIDSRNAWRYCIEESVAAATGRRIDASPLIDEYHLRPWRDALAILAPTAELAGRCCELCETMYERSAMKKLLVHEGIGMALDALRGERIEIGAVSRLPHGLAVKQVQSTGLDRFVAVLSATPRGQLWRPRDRFEACLAFLDSPPGDSAYISGDGHDLAEVAPSGAVLFAASWAHGTEIDDGIPAPGAMHHAIMSTWAQRST